MTAPLTMVAGIAVPDLVSAGVELDVLGQHFDEVPAATREEVLAAHPRSGSKAGILEARVRGYVRPNFCDDIANLPFAE